MQTGSLVATDTPTNLWVREAMANNAHYFPNPPDPNQAYVCKALYPCPYGTGNMVIELEELEIRSINPLEPIFMTTNHWHEVQPPMEVNIEELMNETQLV